MIGNRNGLLLRDWEFMDIEDNLLHSFYQTRIMPHSILKLTLIKISKYNPWSSLKSSGIANFKKLHNNTISLTVDHTKSSTSIYIYNTSPTPMSDRKYHGRWPEILKSQGTMKSSIRLYLLAMTGNLHHDSSRVWMTKHLNNGNINRHANKIYTSDLTPVLVQQSHKDCGTIQLIGTDLR